MKKPEVRTGDLVSIGQNKSGYDLVYVVTLNGPDANGYIRAKRYYEDTHYTCPHTRMLRHYKPLGRRSAFGQRTDEIHAWREAHNPVNMRKDIDALKARIAELEKKLQQ